MAASYRGRYTPGTIEVPAGGSLKLAGTAISSSAAELNLLDADNTEPADGAWAALTRWAKVEYDFATDGGAISAINLGVAIPNNAILLSGIVEKISAFTSGGSATVAISVEGANDVITATAFDNAQFTANIAPAAALAGTQFKTTDARNVTLTIAGAPITAGKYNFHLEYLIGE